MSAPCARAAPPLQPRTLSCGPALGGRSARAAPALRAAPLSVRSVLPRMAPAARARAACPAAAAAAPTLPSLPTLNASPVPPARLYIPRCTSARGAARVAPPSLARTNPTRPCARVQLWGGRFACALAPRRRRRPPCKGNTPRALEDGGLARGSAGGRAARARARRAPPAQARAQAQRMSPPARGRAPSVPAPAAAPPLCRRPHPIPAHNPDTHKPSPARCRPPQRPATPMKRASTRWCFNNKYPVVQFCTSA